jgi:signal transduction histidine kinase
LEDNGRGFAVGEVRKNVSVTSGRAASGNGLENMRRRLAAVGGTCEIHSASGAGTKVIFFVQLKDLALGRPAR